MKYFVATVLTKGKRIEVGLYAINKKEANITAKLKNSGIIIKVVEAEEPLEDKFKRIKNDIIKNIGKKKIPHNPLIASIRQLAVMSNAGISIHDSIIEISNSTSNATLKIIFSKLADDINSGHSLSDAMENYRFEFGNLTIAMVQLGEKTGNIDESLYTLADMLEEIQNNMIKFKKAMAYPRNVMISMAIAFSILIVYVVPQFKSIFEELGANLPLPTVILLSLESLFNNYGLIVLTLMVSTTITLKYLIKTNSDVRFKWHKILLHTIIIKNIIKFSTLNRFTLVFSELIRAGIPIAEALETSIGMIDNLPLKEKLSTVRITVGKGGTLHRGFKETNLFENMVIQMVKAGEESGTLDKMINKVTDYYKMRFDAVIDGLSSAIEPIILLIISSMVLLLALGIFLPMWDMGSIVQGR